MYSVTILLCTWIILAFHLDQAQGEDFNTTNGPVKGKSITILGKSLDVFHGIPYAKPPVGDLRFKRPQPAESWGPKVKEATMEKPSCIQYKGGFGESSIFMDDLRATPDDYSEDCLYLSIWKPSSATKGSNLAVMVWIYGGGFAGGSTRVPLYNSQYIVAENNVIVVAINYRVGPLGFAYLGPDTIRGNMGLLDQVEGMKWVKDNIENFGGDKDRITLFGESAGAFSIGYHLVSPLTRNLFKNAILESGAPVGGLPNGGVVTALEARSFVKKLSVALHCSGSSDLDIYKCLKEAEPQNITDTAAFLQRSSAMRFLPNVDGYYLPSRPIDIIQKNEHKKTNILIGVNKDEATYFYFMFLNPLNRTFIPTGENFNHQNFQIVVPQVTLITDVGQMKALESFYESEENPPMDDLKILNHLASDFLFKCPALQFSLLYAQNKSNNVYLYSDDHTISTMTLPSWMGVPHLYELYLVFGHPLNDSLGFTQEEKELSRNIMKYWTNFAKSDDPNTPEAPVSDWPPFNTENMTYKVLDVANNLATRHGFRRHQCNFVNNILPMLAKDTSNQNLVTSTPGRICTSGSRRLYTGRVSIITSLLTGLFWMQQQ